MEITTGDGLLSKSGLIERLASILTVMRGGFGTVAQPASRTMAPIDKNRPKILMLFIHYSQCQREKLSSVAMFNCAGWRVSVMKPALVICGNRACRAARRLIMPSPGDIRVIAAIIILDRRAPGQAGGQSQSISLTACSAGAMVCPTMIRAGQGADSETIWEEGVTSLPLCQPPDGL